MGSDPEVWSQAIAFGCKICFVLNINELLVYAMKERVECAVNVPEMIKMKMGTEI